MSNLVSGKERDSHLQPPSIVMMTFRFASLICGKTSRMEERMARRRPSLEPVLTLVSLTIPPQTLSSRGLLLSVILTLRV